MNCNYKVMGNTFQRFRKAEAAEPLEPIKDASQTIISFDMSGIEFVSTDEPHIDVSGAQVTMEPIESPQTIVTVVPIMPMIDAPSLTVIPPEPRWLPEGDARRSAIFDALISEIYGDAIMDYESRPKYPEEVNLCAYLCRRFLRLLNPNKFAAKTEELDSEPSEKTNGTNKARQNILDASNQTGKCKTV